MTWPNHRRRGMALLLVLGLLILVATVATATSRGALQAAGEASAAVEDLQAHWLAVSAERTILLQAEPLLRAAEARQGGPVATIATQFEVDEITVAFQLSDDTTRISPIEMVRTGEGWQSRIEDALPPTLRRLFNAKSTGGFLFRNPQRLTYGVFFAPEAGAVPGYDDLLTPYGNGSVNLLRADETALSVALVPPLTKAEVQDLLRARRDLFDEIDDLGRETVLLRMLAEAGVSVNAGGADQLWHAESTRHRLKTTMRSDRRSWQRVRVMDTDKDQAMDITLMPGEGELP